MNKATLYLPSELNHALKEVARRKGRSQAAIMREALEAYVRQQERPRLHSQRIAEDPELNGVGTEDWLTENWPRNQDRRDDPPGWPRSIGIAADPELSSKDIEDWLAANWAPEADWQRE